MRIFWKITIVFLAVTLACSTSKNTRNKTENGLLIEPSNTYIFKAQTALPTGDNMLISNDLQNILPPGSNPGAININGQYWLEIKEDTVTCYLPYYGRAFTASYGENKSALDFQSTQFTLDTQISKKGMQNLVFVFKDQKDVRKMILVNDGNGHANVRFQFNQRQPINFWGTLEEASSK